jgi:hypothetical protein
MEKGKRDFELKGKIDHIELMITLTVITLSSFHCK